MAIFTKTIQRKLLLLLLTVGLLPAFVGAVILYSGSRRALSRSLGDHLRIRAEEVSDRLDQLLLELEQASVRAAAEGWAPDAAGADLRSFAYLYRLEHPGMIPDLATSVGLARELLPVPWTAKVPAPGATLLLERAEEPLGLCLNVLTAARNGEDSGPAVAGVPVQVLVNTLVGASRDSSVRFRILSTRSGMLPGQPRASGVEETLLASPPQRFRAEYTGVVAEGGIPGTGSVAAYSVSKVMAGRERDGRANALWVVVAESDFEEILLFVRYLLGPLFLFGIGLAVVIVVLSFPLSALLVRPIQKLQEQAERCAQGDLSTVVRVHTGDELQSLAVSFNQMIASLRLSQEALEAQVRATESKALQLQLVNDLVQGVVASFELNVLFDRVRAQLSGLVAFDAAAFVIFRGASQCSAYNAGGEVVLPDGDDETALRLFLEERLLARPALPGTIAPSGRFEGEPRLSRQFGQFCLLPLRVERGLIGALVLARRGEEQFSDSLGQELLPITYVVALSIEHIRLYEQARDFAGTLERKVAERAEELARAQERLVNAERFAATGQLAAGIAHEVNNPLGIIKNYLRILQQAPGIGATPGTEDALKAINEELDRIARIVRSLLDFYRPSRIKLMRLDLNDEILALETLFEASLRPKRIRLVLDLEENLPQTELSSDHLRQLLLNLIKNSEDAMPEGGEITIRTRRATGEGEKGVVLEVQDTGRGIPPDVRAHIYEPFFTTKKEGEGTGLGLTVCYGIVENLGGAIECESEPGRGTTFRIRLTG